MWSDELELLLTAVFLTVDGLLPERGKNTIAGKGYVRRVFAAMIAERCAAIILRPERQEEPRPVKDRLGLERRSTRALHGLQARIATRLLALRSAASAAFAVTDHEPARPELTGTQRSEARHQSTPSCQP